MQVFLPSRQRGLVLHIILAIVLAAVAVFAFWLAFDTQVGLSFALYLLLFLVCIIPVPILSYRAYALTRASYMLDRNILRLNWGLRSEDIPVSNVEWVRPVQGLIAPLNLPWLRLPGGILGVTRQPDIGLVEFMASETDTMLLVATARRVYAISPADPSGFSVAFQKVIEMGSLATGQAHSQYPSFVVAQAWDSLVVRYLWLASAFLNIGTLVWVSILIPSVNQVPLGFSPAGLPTEPVPSVQLVLLPFLNAVLLVVGWLVGLFFYRRVDQRLLAVAVWVSGALTSLFFLLAVFFIATTPF